jgi:hypothetical protein
MTRRKQPYAIVSADEPVFAFAGLRENRRDRRASRDSHLQHITSPLAKANGIMGMVSPGLGVRHSAMTPDIATVLPAGS